MSNRELRFCFVISTFSFVLLSYTSAINKVETCAEVQFVSEYKLGVNGYDLYYFLLENDSIIIAGRSDSIPISGIQSGEARLLNRQKYKLPISMVSSSDFLFPGILAVELPSPRGNQFYSELQSVYIPPLVRVFLSSHINGGFINSHQCE